VGEDSVLFSDLSATNEMRSLGFDIARSASNTLGDGVIDALPYLLLVLVVGVSGWFQHQMIRKRQTGAAVNPTQEMIMKFMPFFLPVFAFSLPAAIVFYFLVSNLYRIAQQYYITRSFYSGDQSMGAQIRQNRENSPDDAKQNGSGPKNGTKSNSGKKPAAKKAAAKKPAAKRQGGGSGANGGKSGKHKSKTSTAARTGAPGRNSSGREASARANVQPKARKKKKR
jgi:YidC/Oxa1 family membrane protein insertase